MLHVTWGKGVQVDADVLHRMQKAFGNTWGDVLSNLQSRSQVSCLAGINDEFENFLISISFLHCNILTPTLCMYLIDFRVTQIVSGIRKSKS